MVETSLELLTHRNWFFHFHPMFYKHLLFYCIHLYNPILWDYLWRVHCSSMDHRWINYLLPCWMVGGGRLWVECVCKISMVIRSDHLGQHWMESLVRCRQYFWWLGYIFIVVVNGCVTYREGSNNAVNCESFSNYQAVIAATFIMYNINILQ